MLMRRGVTLIELIVALVLCAIVFGMATVSLLRQQQGNSWARSSLDASAQFEGSVRVLGDQLSALERAHDLLDGEVRDTALQFRAPIVSSLACTTSPGVVNVVADTSTVPLTGSVSTPKPGDTLWWRADTAWQGAQVTLVTAAATNCAAALAGFTADARLSLTRPDTIAAGTPVRVTRQTRYSLYRASDGSWQLGFREASGIPARFAASQPVVGPLIPRSGSRRTGFRYFDSTNTELVPGAAGAAAGSVARIRITAWAVIRAHAPGADSLRADSIDVALGHARGP